MAHVSTLGSSTTTARRHGAPAELAERLGWTVVSLATLVALWALAAYLTDTRHLPGPATVLGVLAGEAASGALWYNLAITLVRVAAAFALAMLVGSAIGLAIGSNKLADKFFDSWVVLFLNLPALVIIALLYTWLGTFETTIILVVALNKIPNVAVQMREGARSLSKDLAEMAQIYSFGTWKTLRHVTIPQLAPFWAAAARQGLALVWKIVLVAEALGGHPSGVGHQIHAAFNNYDVPSILAYALAFITIIQIVELGFLQPLQSRVSKWRR
jgi:NitT/TauT family transport system permease protein